MDVSSLKNKKIAIWGAGVEGCAAAEYLDELFPGISYYFIDDKNKTVPVVCGKKFLVVSDLEEIAAVLAETDVVIKSPGVSLYHPLLEKEKNRGIYITSLLNLWLSDKRSPLVIGITGTKGKSTTATLLGHVLNELGKKAGVLGNIGVPVSKISKDDADYIVVEISSYQAATLAEKCDIGVVTSLFPEHLDWHKTTQKYYEDKIKLLANSKVGIIEASVRDVLEENNINIGGIAEYGQSDGWHFVKDDVYKGTRFIGELKNDYLLREHNKSNVCAVMAVVDELGLDASSALDGMKSYRGLPHRQQELGEKNGILFVDDSISTTPQSTIAALNVYRGKTATLIVGGFDRGVDYIQLVNYLSDNPVNAVVCMGQSGERIFSYLKNKNTANIFLVSSMKEAVATAINNTKSSGVVLLSPASPSFDMFENYKERAESFIREINL